MANILTLQIPSSSKTGKQPSDYLDYLVAYKLFSSAKYKFAPGSTETLDSQFSECLAADYFSFVRSTENDFDGYKMVGSKKEYFEVKGTGYDNNRVSFNPLNKADHVIWIKVTPTDVIIKEISTTIYNSLPSVLAGERA
jgi:hypothetical protein